jgi:hypothetical protein
MPAARMLRFAIGKARSLELQASRAWKTYTDAALRRALLKRIACTALWLNIALVEKSVVQFWLAGCPLLRRSLVLLLSFAIVLPAGGSFARTRSFLSRSVDPNR